MRIRVPAREYGSVKTVSVKRLLRDTFPRCMSYQWQDMIIVLDERCTIRHKVGEVTSARNFNDPTLGKVGVPKNYPHAKISNFLANTKTTSPS